MEFEFAKETISLPKVEPVKGSRQTVAAHPIVESVAMAREIPAAEPAPIPQVEIKPTPTVSPVPASPPPSNIELEPIPVRILPPTPEPPKTTMSNSPIKPSSITDFKRNIDQQKKEQKSLNNVLSTVTYAVLIGLILVTALTGFGAYQFWMTLKEQATSISSLDQKYEAEVTGINEDLRRTKTELEKTTAQIAHQEEELSILRATLEKTIADAKADRAARARETASLQKRVSDLENKGNR